ncbi:hypothetical protein TetV_222 [Tetraselmis virus 1]|uniref:Uncharacterized protein n=1 Tax=Tetraselmis virus 1 TaxID=2060617 RepID=A0A2P0VN39_9VIRU|nr:hypothetical protein QJ968_gp222 [Tetraselmis virus 1]AUF82314.1 hypothetical protein TetV_222 [Tetraselmis virus 1]
MRDLSNWILLVICMLLFGGCIIYSTLVSREVKNKKLSWRPPLKTSDHTYLLRVYDVIPKGKETMQLHEMVGYRDSIVPLVIKNSLESESLLLLLKTANVVTCMISGNCYRISVAPPVSDNFQHLYTDDTKEEFQTTKQKINKMIKETNESLKQIGYGDVIWIMKESSDLHSVPFSTPFKNHPPMRAISDATAFNKFKLAIFDYTNNTRCA